MGLAAEDGEEPGGGALCSGGPPPPPPGDAADAAPPPADEEVAEAEEGKGELSGTVLARSSRLGSSGGSRGGS